MARARDDAERGAFPTRHPRVASASRASAPSPTCVERERREPQGEAGEPCAGACERRSEPGCGFGAVQTFAVTEEQVLGLEAREHLARRC